MKRLFQPLFALVLGVLLAACAMTGQQAPKSAEDNLRYAQATLTGVYKTIQQQSDARAAPYTELKSYKDRADEAKGYLDAADLAIGQGAPVDSTTVQGKLQLALSILQPLLLELQKRFPQTK